MLVETAVVVTLFCSTARRSIDYSSGPVHISSSLAKPLFIQGVSGDTLESSMVKEIENLPGVLSVAVKRSGDTFDVSVIMQNMDFDPYNAVIRKKVQLFNTYPSFTFNFDVMPTDAAEAPLLAFHAA